MILYTKINNTVIKLTELQSFPEAVISWQQANEFLRIVTGSEKSQVSSQLSRMCETLRCEESLWPVLIPEQSRDYIVKSKKEELHEAILNNLEYFSLWLENRKFLDSLQPFRVDTEKIKNISYQRSEDSLFDVSNCNGQAHDNVRFKLSCNAKRNTKMHSGGLF